MATINWGIIGCGDVTEIKSGPAFNKVANSKLVAVMRRNADLAKDYAVRHGVSRWYSDANALIHDDEVNAIYVATPPSSHLPYTLAAIAAGKPVYVEKPMTLNHHEAWKIADEAKAHNVKVVVAHYRRAQPLFKKVKELIEQKAIGNIWLANLKYYQPALKPEQLSVEKYTWRIQPKISGGGLFHDIAPHQADLAYYFFGAVEKVGAVAARQGSMYNADDLVAGFVLFQNNVVFNGCWCFNAATTATADEFEIIGSLGKISFSVFKGNTIKLTTDSDQQVFTFDALEHVQQPMIDAVVRYFLGEEANPNSPEEGAEVMRILDAFTAK